jgi:hypothetical protein
MKYFVDIKAGMDMIAREIGIENDTKIDNMRIVIFREVIDLLDQGTREALIKLGWTPPKDKENRNDEDKNYIG